MDKALWILYSAVFLDLLGFGIMVPLLPFLAMTFGADAAHLGMMTTAFSAMQFVGNLTLGNISDKYGRKVVLCGCLLGSAVSYLAFGLAKNLTTLIVLRGLSGFFSGTIGSTQAWVAGIVSEEERPVYMGYIGVCIGAGFAIGPGLGGALKQVLGFEGPCFITAGVCFLNFLAGCFFLTEPPRSAPVQEDQSAGEAETKAPPSAIATLRQYPQCLLVCISTCCYYAAFAGFESMGAIFFKAVYGLNEASFGYICSCSGLAAIIIQKYCVKPATQKIGLVGACVSAHAFRMAAYLVVVLTHFAWSPFVMAVFIAGGSLLSSGSASILSLFSPEECRGTVLSMNQSFAALGRALGPMVCSTLYAINPSMLWYGASVLCAFGMLACWCIKAITADDVWILGTKHPVTPQFRLDKRTTFLMCAANPDANIPIPATLQWQFLVARTIQGDQGGYFEAMFSHKAHMGALLGEKHQMSSSSVATAMFPPAAHVSNLEAPKLTRSATEAPSVALMKKPW